MFKPIEQFLAFRYLRARRREGFISVISWFSLIGIALGVATLIIVMSVMNGFREELFARVLGLNGHMHVVSTEGGPLTDYERVVKQALTLKGITAAMPTVEAQALISTGSHASGAVVRGMQPEDLRRLSTVSGHIIAGSLQDFGEGSVVIGVRMAQNLGLGPGEAFTLISPRGSPTVFGMSPRLKSYRIAAVFDVGMYEYDANFVFMSLVDAQAFFRMGSYVTGVDLMVDKPQELAPYRDALTRLFPAPYKIVDWQESNASFFTALQVERNVMFLILTLIIVVAAFNIISGLIMLVKDKSRDIAILRTMGASRAMVMNVFFISGASIGVIGTLAGLLLGVLFAENIETIRQGIQALTHTDLFSAEIYFLSKLPARIDWMEVLQVTAMALLLSFLATLYPSWRAARMDPVEALRYE